MLTKEENELLCQVGLGTPMGNLVRQYWLPVMLSEELAEKDGDPLRIKLLGEDLVIFRDTLGRVGILDEACSHRGASLYFGRNEECGLRCIYHGWKYDVEGRCVDMPNEPEHSNFKDKIRHPAYPCREAGGMIWTYMGPRKDPPPMPDLEWMHIPATHRRLAPFQRACNWVQALEGDIDTSHLYFLHGRLNPNDPPSVGVYHPDRHPLLEIVKTNYGLVYGARRAESPTTDYLRITQFLFPIHTFFPGYPDGTVPGHIWVPLDDEHTMVWTIGWNPTRPMSEATIGGRTTGSGIGEYLPDTSDGLGRWRPRANKSNDYEQDRHVQRTKTFTGIPTIPLQDQAVTESMGPIYKRYNEHLGTSDAMLIQVRRRLIAAAKALQEDGTIPPGVENPEWYRVRSGSATIAKNGDWVELMGDWIFARNNDVPAVELAIPG